MSHNVWFTADTHFGQGNVIKYCKRPFLDKAGNPDPSYQDEVIIQRFNEVLRPGDILWHLGDVSWSSFDKLNGFLKRLNTKEVHLIWGNHDKPKNFKGLPFRSFSDLRSIKVADSRMILCHYPMRSWNGKGSGTYQLYGHVHGQMPGIDRQMDVGVDTNNFYPWAFEEIRDRMERIPYNNYD